ncbi:Hypp7906 [Branchiostoma lanceolatum]|uniref:Hypp7906 protein n=1 Tax=Branchiostoma lanceolatum TaxID=7740 RepID=A0A8J9Z582_BRALA|nr:Hypp7906 [Branchiostoma lanceolatum]
MSTKLVLVILCLSLLAMVLGSSGSSLRGAGGLQAECEGCGEGERLAKFLLAPSERAYSTEGTRGRSGLLSMLLKEGIVGARARRNPLPRVSMDISTMLLGELLAADGAQATTDHNFELFRQAGK